MTTTAATNKAEAARRRDYVNESRAALQNNETIERRSQKRETKADQWSQWFRRKMDDAGCCDPAAILPDAFARLEQLAEDRANAAVREFKTALRKALT
jgi:hypothetical protein